MYIDLPLEAVLTTLICGHILLPKYVAVEFDILRYLFLDVPELDNLESSPCPHQQKQGQ